MRKYLLLIFLFIATPCFAIDTTPRTYNIFDWSKGLNSYVNEYLTPNNQGVIFQNTRIDKKYGALSNRTSLLTYGTVGAFKINGLHRYYKSDDTKRLITGYSTFLKYGTDATGVFTDLATGLTDSERWNFLTYKNKVIGINGSDLSLKWDMETGETANTDGNRTTDNLMAELGACYSELDTGTDLDASAWYGWRIVLFDNTNTVYYYSTATSNNLLTGAAVHNAALTDIPIGPANITHRYVYRTEGYASRALLRTALTAESLYLVGTIADNITTIYADSVTDDTLDDDAAPTWATSSAGTNITPPICKYMGLANQRVFMAGNSDNKSKIYFSEELLPDWFKTITDYEEVQPDDGDEITGIEILWGIPVIFKTNSISKYYIEGNPSVDWKVRGPFSVDGCPAPYTIDSTTIGIFYLGWDGIYNFDGQYSHLISEVVTDVVKDISKANIEECVGVFYNNKYHLSYISSESGESANNRVLRYDITKDYYTIDLMNINAFTKFSSGSDTYVLYSGSSLADGYVWAHSEGKDQLLLKFKSEIDEGTFDDSASYGDEDDFIVDIARSTSWDDTTDTWNNQTGIWDREDTDGSWTSAIYRVNASVYNKLKWNEDLTSPYGTVTFQIRSAATSAGIATATWSTTLYTDPFGSDVSGETAGVYVQIRANLSTSSINFSPDINVEDDFIVKLDFLTEGSEYESSIYIIWRSGWTNFEVASFPKLIKRIKVYYTGSLGDLNIRYRNDAGTVDNTYAIDLATDPFSSGTDEYTGIDGFKVHTHQMAQNEYSDGEYFQFEVSYIGATEWDVFRIEVLYNTMEIFE